MRPCCLTALLLALLASQAACAATVFQLDVCNKHRTISEAPGMSLTVTKDGMCVLTGQMLSAAQAGEPRSCKASRSSTAVLLRFPCKEEPRLKQASGPAMNVWGSFEGVPQPTKTGVVVKQSLHAAKLMDAAAASGGESNNTTRTGACSFLTLNPGLYYHKSPPMFTYGYVVSGLPCERATSALAVTQSLEKGGGKTFATTYSIWLKPTLPAPPLGMSGDQQACNLVISVLSRSYVSSDTFPCHMSQLAPESLDDGCCNNAGGSTMGRRLFSWGSRHLLSSYEKAMSFRRALQL